MSESRDNFRAPFRAALAEALRKRRAARTSRDRQAGQALALTAVSLAILLLAAGLAIDTGVLRYQKRRMQTAADSAAIAGADSIYGNVQSAAQNDAALNGYTNGGTTQVTAQCGASLTGGFGACGGSGTPYVQVSVAQQEPLFFMKIIPGITDPTVSTQATAYYGNGRNCMYGLQVGAGASIMGAPSGSTATTTLDLNACGLLSNGGINIQACLNLFSASSIGYSGSSSVSSCSPSPAPSQIAAQAADPLAYLTPPGNPGTCPPSGMATGYIAGRFSYPCGLQIINSSAPITLAPGTYLLGAPPGGNALFISGNGNAITGNGVTFYIASGQVAICQSGTGTIVTGTPCSTGAPMSITLTAPTAGSMAGILFYQDPSDRMPATIMGNDAFGLGNTDMEGVFYFPSASLTLAELTDGTNWQTTYNAAVANTLSVIGTVRFGSDYSTLPNGSPIKDAVLVQ